MKFDPGETWAETIARKSVWHLWFAWRPVRVEDHHWRWLEFVERRCTYAHSWGEAYWTYEYRAFPE